MRTFEKLSRSSVCNLLKSLQYAVINRIEKGILVIFFGDNLRKLIHHQLCKISGNFIAKTQFYFKMKFSVEILKRLC